MRGCLFVLVLGAAFILGAVWLAGPPLAAGLVRTGLAATGFEAQSTTVDVAADPPFELLTGHADRVRIRATSASVEGLTARDVDLVLTGVDLIGRRAERVKGAFSGVTVGGASDPVAIDGISVDGPAARARATITIPAASIEATASRAIQARIGAAPGGLRLAAPDGLAFTVGGQTLRASLSVTSSGDLVATLPAPASGAAVLVDAATLRPLRATAVEVGGGALVLTGLLDLDALLR